MQPVPRPQTVTECLVPPDGDHLRRGNARKTARWQAEQLVAWTSERMVFRIALVRDEQMRDIRRGKKRLEHFRCDTTRIEELILVRAREIKREVGERIKDLCGSSFLLSDRCCGARGRGPDSEFYSQLNCGEAVGGCACRGGSFKTHWPSAVATPENG